jgi:hypothetical protein
MKRPLRPGFVIGFLTLVVCYFSEISSACGYYNPTTGRWLSRDPITEQGGSALHGFVMNDPIDRIDPLGLEIRNFWDHYTVKATWRELRSIFLLGGPFTVGFHEGPFSAPTVWPLLGRLDGDGDFKIEIAPLSGGSQPQYFRLPPECKWIPHTLEYLGYHDRMTGYIDTGNRVQIPLIGVADVIERYMERTIDWHRQACCLER